MEGEERSGRGEDSKSEVNPRRSGCSSLTRELLYLGLHDMAASNNTTGFGLGILEYTADMASNYGSSPPPPPPPPHPPQSYTPEVAGQLPAYTPPRPPKPNSPAPNRISSTPPGGPHQAPPPPIDPNFLPPGIADKSYVSHLLAGSTLTS